MVKLGLIAIQTTKEKVEVAFLFHWHVETFYKYQ